MPLSWEQSAIKEDRGPLRASNPSPSVSGERHTCHKREGGHWGVRLQVQRGRSPKVGRLGMGEQEPGSQHQVNLKGKGVKGAGIQTQHLSLRGSCAADTTESVR
eukprot:EG_transcript_66520